MSQLQFDLNFSREGKRCIRPIRFYYDGNIYQIKLLFVLLMIFIRFLLLGLKLQTIFNGQFELCSDRTVVRQIEDHLVEVSVQKKLYTRLKMSHMSRKLIKFLILFDNSNLLFFPGQFLSGRIIVEVDDDMPVLGKKAVD